ncbi:MAG: helix-turn-helix domain-containing protein [Alphaproteobacteria bacterium]|nr:helix-turn-helix domain-containing protein [Alphaproteobacteria bacterium]
MGGQATKHLDGRQVRAMRREAGLSQSDFADSIGINQATVSRWERGHQPLGHHWCQTVLDFFGRLPDTDGRTPVLPFTDIDDNWPDLISYYRMTRSLSQLQLAEILDVENTTIYRWENGLSVPCLKEQRLLRDMILAPIGSNAQFMRVRQRISDSSAMMYMCLGRIILAHSEPLNRMNSRSRCNFPAYSRSDEVYGGKLAEWMKARDQSGFFRGDVVKTSTICSLTPNDTRRMVAFPLPLECGSVLTVGYHRSVTTREGMKCDGQFELNHADELAA